MQNLFYLQAIFILVNKKLNKKLIKMIFDI